ncbi:cation-translocating P-type ATPase [Microbacterium sp. NPDC057407]|uniref:cation-translocating P-type ATPase n=1 Tax=Microbacterium sp. NPDC057407 TaxID=3346120 RepID=UPI00366FD340
MKSSAAEGATRPDAPREGLTSAEASARLALAGPNVVAPPRRRSPVRMVLEQLTHLLALLLWAAAALALMAGTPELAVAIVVIVLLNAGFAFLQEYRADRSAERLRDLLPTRARVLRDGVPVQIPMVDLVPGDVVLLTPGDRVGADLQVVTADDLRLDESLVTGESTAVPRRIGDGLRSGTFVIQGEATAVVTATGDRTGLAEIGRLVADADRPPSPLTVELRRVVRVVAVIATVVGAGLGIASVALGLSVSSAFIFAVGVAVALIPEGLLPTVTLSLARGAQRMAAQNALVRRLDAVESLGATTFICTDKTGTLTQNRMSVVEVVTLAGAVSVHGDGYEPRAELDGDHAAKSLVPTIAEAALRCVTGRVVGGPQGWEATGDPMEAAFHCLALRVGVADEPVVGRAPYSPERMISSALSDDRVSVIGATEAVFARCDTVPERMHTAVRELTGRGRRVLAVATRSWHGDVSPEMERGLELIGLVALEDPPREGVAEALQKCRSAGVRIAMITGDHPWTGEAIAREVGLLGPHGAVLEGPVLPADDVALAGALDREDGVVVARATPADKLRIARALRSKGHVVAMTGDGVNDAPALREADVGVAMGAGGSDVAREAADLVVLDDHFATIVLAIELGRATFKNVRRFLTYHLTDNVAELAPFVVWALSGGSIPLAIGVLQVIALDIGSDMLPALALGAEPARDDVMRGHRSRSLVDRSLLTRAFLVLGLVEATVALAAFLTVLAASGWRWGAAVTPEVLATASGTAFAAIALGQIANAFACRSTTRPVWRLRLSDNPLVLYAVGAQALLLIAFLGIEPVAELLGGTWPSPLGWLVAGAAVPAVILVDAIWKSAVSARAWPGRR